MAHTLLGYCPAAQLFEWNVPESKMCTTDSSSDPARGLYVETTGAHGVGKAANRPSRETGNKPHSLLLSITQTEQQQIND
jgi:hypothetical protein